jgi:hypothetical protein
VYKGVSRALVAVRWQFSRGFLRLQCTYLVD